METSTKVLHQRLVERLKAERISQKLTHAKLAEKAGITRPSISFIESGKTKPTLFVCLKLCKAMNISLADIIKEAEQ